MTLQPLPEDRHLPGAESVTGGLFGRASKVAGWVARTGYDAAKKVPGVEAAERGLQQLERAALSEVRKRLEATAQDDALLRRAQAPTPGGVPVITTHGDFEPLRATMAELLHRWLGYSTAEARVELYAQILGQLTPDEARIVAALSDGEPFALVDVVERAGVGGAGQVVVSNVCDVGKAAGVTLDAYVPVFVGRLMAAGLAERRDETPALGDRYEVLLTDGAVRSALQGKRTKVIRRTLFISRFGLEFWRAGDPSDWQ